MGSLKAVWISLKDIRVGARVVVPFLLGTFFSFLLGPTILTLALMVSSSLLNTFQY